MTDKEMKKLTPLIYRLTMKDYGDVPLGALDAMMDAADRIKALVKERDAALALLVVAADNIRSLHRAETAEAKLAKAVAALKGVVPYWDKANPLRLADHHHDGHDCDRCKFDHARAVLAELEKTE